MTFIRTTTPADASGAVAAMYLRQQSAWGYLPNYAKVFCHRPEVMARWGQLLAEIRRPMDRRRFELVTFAAAHELRNSACALAHGRALREFLTDAQIRAIADDRADDGLTAAELALVRFARQVARDAAGVTAADVAVLREHGYSDAEIFDVAATAAGRAFFTKVLDALGVQPDAPFRDLDAPLRDALTVGRPIDERDCVTVPIPDAR
jgi:uncharacterized peroxidase-related enzyme